MAGSQAIECVGPSEWLRDRKTAIQRAVNCYPMAAGVAGAQRLVLESAPGLALVHDFGAEVRGMRSADGRLFVVAGAVLYEVSQDGGVSALGSLATASGYVSMTNGEGQLAIVDGRNLYEPADVEAAGIAYYGIGRGRSILRVT